MGIKEKMKVYVRRIKYGVRSDSDTYINYLRNIGMKIGERTVVFDPRFTLIDETRPWAIDIGDDVQITHGVTILTHGYDWSVLKGKYGTVLGSYGGVKIENNVFIGMNATILKGVHIGRNVVVGAGSLVNKNIPDDCIVAGNPAKVIMMIDEYYEKRKKMQEKEAVDLACDYKERYGRWPDEKALSEFFWLYSGGMDINYDELKPFYKEKMKLVGNEEYSKEMILQNQPLFSDFNAFINRCKNECCK